MRNHSGRRLILWIGVSFFVLPALLDETKMTYYLIHSVSPLCALLGIWLADIWTGGGMKRALSICLTMLFVLMNVGWVAYNASRDARHREFADVVLAIRERAAPGDLIIGPPQLGFEFGFFDNVIDDSGLGYYSGKRPQFIAIDANGYAEAMPLYASKAPDLHQYVTQLLGQSTLIVENRLYKVYASKPRR
jgi:hypothetical protein